MFVEQLLALKMSANYSMLFYQIPNVFIKDCAKKRFKEIMLLNFAGKKCIHTNKTLVRTI